MRGIAALFLLLAAGPALAQQRVVVPADSALAVPARGAAAVPTVAATRPRLTRTGRQGGPTSPSRAGGGGDATVQGLVAPALIGLPLAAAAGALIAGAAGSSAPVPGLGSGTTAPARTR